MIIEADWPAPTGGFARNYTSAGESIYKETVALRASTDPIQDGGRDTSL
jgi:hypothetical protein